MPLKMLLVLDVNGLLADTYFETEPRPEKAADAKLGRRFVYKRPFVEEFLQFCLDNFVVGIWSSARMHNVKRLVDFVLGDDKRRLAFCWDQSDCTDTGLKAPDNKHKPVFCKELARLWETVKPNLPWKKGDYGPANTLLIDDTPYKALLNPPHTAIFPRPYTVSDSEDNFLGCELLRYLKGILVAKDVQSYIEKNPFGEPSLTSASPLWDYFSEIVLSCKHVVSKAGDVAAQDFGNEQGLQKHGNHRKRVHGKAENVYEANLEESNLAVELHSQNKGEETYGLQTTCREMSNKMQECCDISSGPSRFVVPLDSNVVCAVDLDNAKTTDNQCVLLPSHAKEDESNHQYRCIIEDLHEEGKQINLPLSGKKDSSSKRSREHADEESNKKPKRREASQLGKNKANMNIAVDESLDDQIEVPCERQDWPLISAEPRLAETAMCENPGKKFYAEHSRLEGFDETRVSKPYVRSSREPSYFNYHRHYTNKGSHEWHSDNWYPRGKKERGGSAMHYSQNESHFHPRNKSNDFSSKNWYKHRGNPRYHHQVSNYTNKRWNYNKSRVEDCDFKGFQPDMATKAQMELGDAYYGERTMVENQRSVGWTISDRNLDMHNHNPWKVQSGLSREENAYNKLTGWMKPGISHYGENVNTHYRWDTEQSVQQTSYGEVSCMRSDAEYVNRFSDSHQRLGQHKVSSQSYRNWSEYDRSHRQWPESGVSSCSREPREYTQRFHSHQERGLKNY